MRGFKNFKGSDASGPSMYSYSMVMVYDVLNNYTIDNLRWLDTVLKQIDYSLLNIFNFYAVKFK